MLPRNRPLFETTETNKPAHYVAIFVTPKADILNDTSGDYPVMFVVNRAVI